MRDQPGIDAQYHFDRLFQVALGYPNSSGCKKRGERISCSVTGKTSVCCKRGRHSCEEKRASFLSRLRSLNGHFSSCGLQVRCRICAGKRHSMLCVSGNIPLCEVTRVSVGGWWKPISAFGLEGRSGLVVCTGTGLRCDLTAL